MTGSGHKTEFMLDHYAEHMETERALNQLEAAQEKLFLPIIEKAENIIDIDAIVQDEEAITAQE